jgi:hypothetical protein
LILCPAARSCRAGEKLSRWREEMTRENHRLLESKIPAAENGLHATHAIYPRLAVYITMSHEFEASFRMHGM